MLLILSIWAGLALRGQPLMPYVAAYFLSVVPATIGEFIFSTVLDTYDLWAYLLEDHQRDLRLSQLVVRHGLTPLLTVLYLRYRPRSPLWVTIGSAVSLGLLEMLYVAVGAMTYKGWSPIYTVLLYGIHFTVMGAIFPRLLRWPVWIHAGAFAFALENFSDVLLHGVMGLWENHLPGVADNLGDKIITLTHDAIFVAIFLLLCGRRPSPERQALLLAVMLLVEYLGLAFGLIRHEYWSLPLSAIREAVVIILTALYLDWWQRTAGRNAA